MALLGCRIVRRQEGLRLSGRIVETEAYIGTDDRACHAARGLTRRNAVMFGPAGFAYVYFIYGMYDMLNVVCQPTGTPEAVLIRAIEPEEGIEEMRRRRRVRRAVDITNGPGKLCRALNVTRADNGKDLSGRELWIEAGSLRPGETLGRGPRVGVDYAGPDALRPLRFFIEGHSHVSSPRPVAHQAAAAKQRQKGQRRQS